MNNRALLEISKLLLTHDVKDRTGAVALLIQNGFFPEDLESWCEQQRKLLLRVDGTLGSAMNMWRAAMQPVNQQWEDLWQEYMAGSEINKDAGD